MSFYESKHIGDILRRIDDNARIEKLLSTTSLNVMLSLFNLAVFGIVLAVFNLSIFFVFIALSVLYVIYSLLFMRKRAELDHKRFAEMTNNQTTLIQTIHGMCDIKLNNCATQKRWEWEKIQAKIFRINVEYNRWQQYQDVGSLMLTESKNIVITAMAALAVVNGQMTLGMMVAVQYIIGQLNTPLNDFMFFTRDLQDAKISLERIGEIHKLENEQSHLEQYSELPHSAENKNIVVKNLSFRYSGSLSPLILDDLNFIIPQGKITAIVGPSGSGKTTLMKLLLKIYQPTSGIIRFGEVNLAEVNAAEWRKCCGCVLQDGYIFSDTISKNIALGDEPIDRQKLFHAAVTANIKEHIDSLPLRYNTTIGVNGVGLSQGQKQRLLIARAIYRNPEIILLDEATSALDANNEKSIMENLQNFFRGKTVLVIAHRLSTVKNADQIIVLEKGKIVESGTHNQLTQSRGKYFALVRNQLELGS